MPDLILETTYFEKGGPENTDKALEIAKKYGTDDSPKFINGVLHRIKEEVGKWKY